MRWQHQRTTSGRVTHHAVIGDFLCVVTTPDGHAWRVMLVDTARCQIVYDETRHTAQDGRTAAETHIRTLSLASERDPLP